MFWKKKTKEERDAILREDGKTSNNAFFDEVEEKFTNRGKTQFPNFWDIDFIYFNVFEMPDEVIEERLRASRRERAKAKAAKNRPTTLRIIVDKPSYKSIYDSMETETIQFEML